MEQEGLRKWRPASSGMGPRILTRSPHPTPTHIYEQYLSLGDKVCAVHTRLGKRLGIPCKQTNNFVSLYV